ncbi:MAG: sulfotransferase domain-containing protein [Pseudomonadota bacterium]
MLSAPVVDFLVIGAMKCGTSTVCAYLEDHPDAYMVPMCEPRFFSRDENWAAGVGTYEAYFQDTESHQLRGEGSNDYSNLRKYGRSPERIHSYNPDIKLVYVIRDPITRIKSDWIQRRVDQGIAIPDTVNAAVASDDTYVGQSLYWETITAYQAYFPDSQIHVCFMEDLNREPALFFAALTTFLGLAPFGVERPHANKSAGKLVPGKAYTRLASAPLFRPLKALFPQRFKTFVKNNILSVTAKEVKFTPDDVAPEQRAIIKADAASVLAYAGKPPDFWHVPQ